MMTVVAGRRRTAVGLLRTTSAFALFAGLAAGPAPAAAAQAAAAPPAATGTATQAEVQPETTPDIVVTGTNIRRNANATASAPVVQVGRDQIEGVAAVTVGDTLSRVPSITADLSPSSNNTSSGAAASNVGVATTSLRNLGSARTLVLVDGRRFVSGVSANTGFGVDLNAIPTATIERIDVLTGGQSAIYGSDAIAGVINIVTRRNFTGLELNAFGGAAQHGGAGRQNYDATYGRNFDGGNVWVSAGYAQQDALYSRDRPFARDEQRFVDTNADGILDTIAVRDGPFHVPGAALVFGKLAIFGNGAPFNTNQPLLDANFNRQGTTDYDNQNASRYLVSPFKRYYAASGLTADLGGGSRIDFGINYTRTTAFAAIEPNPVSVVADVFKVPQGGTTGIDIAMSPYFTGSSAGAQLVAALGPNTSLDRITTFRRLVELGPRTTSLRRETFRVTGGFVHDFGPSLSFAVNGVYGQTSETQNNTGDFSIPNFRNAVTIVADGRGGYQCANQQARLEGCLPINPFGTIDSTAGRAGLTGISPTAARYLAVATGQSGRIEQIVFNGVLSGQLPFQFADKPIGFAVGVEYRKEQAREDPDAYRQKGLSRDPQISAIAGSFDVKEAFAEVDAPIFHWLTLSAAGRVGDYSTVSTKFTWRVGGDAPVVRWARLRASYSSSVRAPNVNDLFSNGVSSIAAANTDACNGVTAATTGNVAVNCRSIPAIAQRIAANGAFRLVASEANNTTLITAGSPSVRAETAKTLTAGVVFTPLRRVSLSFDYYDIDIRDGITRLSPDVYVQRCYGATPGSFDASCGGTLTRDVNAGPILTVAPPLINAANIKTRGVDAELNYTQRGLSVSIVGNYLNRFDVVGATGATEQFDGRPQYPHWRVTGSVSYDFLERFSLFSQVRFRSRTFAYVTATNLSNDLNTLKSVAYGDLRLSYRPARRLELYVGVNNLFDTDPDILPRDPAIGTNTDPRAYDVIGRQLFGGVKVRL